MFTFVELPIGSWELPTSALGSVTQARHAGVKGLKSPKKSAGKGDNAGLLNSVKAVIFAQSRVGATGALLYPRIKASLK